MKKRFLFLLSAGLLLAVGLTAAWLMVPGGIDESRAALAEYDLQKMTCGSCVANIETALQELRGVGEVQVNLTREQGRISFDPSLTDAETIARVITAAGYPAILRNQMNAGELAALRAEEAQMSRKYVAKIGDRYITREEFKTRIDQALGRQPDRASPETLAAAWRRTWDEMLQRELLLAAAAANEIVVQPGEVDARLEEITARHPGLEDRIIAQYGSREDFRQLLREDMIIQRNLDENVVAGVAEGEDRRRLLQAWYADLNRSTEVKIYDPQLKTLTAAGSGGCGGSCCG